MNRLSQRRLVVVLVLTTVIAGARSLVAAPKKTEAELIQMLSSRDQSKVLDALDRLPHWYPDSTNALAAVKEQLRMPDKVGRKAARALGYYHADMGPEDMKFVYAFLKS